MELKTLSELRGVSGQEGPVREYICARLAGHVDETHSDTLGNLFAWKRAANPRPLVMFAAHMDEVGFLVTGIDKDGFLHLGAVGGVDPAVIPGKTVLVGPRKIPGVIGSKPVHVQEPDERTKPFESKKLYVDIGAGSREAAAKAVELGDQVTFATAFGSFGEGLWKGKALDDRIGCAVLGEVLKGAYPVSVVGVFTVQEEIGSRGADVAANRILPDIGVCLEGTVCADIPDSEADAEATRLGSGPAISVMDAGTVYDPGLVKHLVALAKREGIPHQFRRAVRGGNDAGRMTLAGTGARTCAVSVPCRYIHSPVAVANPEDFNHAVRLLRAFLESIGRGELKA